MKNDTCPYHSLAEDTQPIAGGYTFQQLNLIIAGSCTAFAVASSFLLMLQHATHLSKYNEQAKIMKIIALIPWYSILCLLSINTPTAYVYLDPWTDYVESIAMGSFFLLMSEFVSPYTEQRDVFFAALQVKSRRGDKPPRNGLKWYRRAWINIFQYPLVSLIVGIATAVTQALNVYCLWASNAQYAHLWLDLADSISVSLAIISILQMYILLRHDLANHKPLAKLVAFKLIVFLSFIQGIIFWILRDTNAVNPTDTLSYADLYIGIPELLLCIEMALLSIFFHYAYSYKPYVIDHSNGSTATYQGGFLGWRLLISVFDPREIFQAQLFALKIISEYSSDNESMGNDMDNLQRKPLAYNDATYDTSNTLSNAPAHGGFHVSPSGVYNNPPQRNDINSYGGSYPPA